MLGKIAGPLQPFAPLLLRLPLGIIFIAHGANKLFGTFNGASFDTTVAQFAAMGFTPPEFHAALAGGGELLGGLLVLLGLGTRFGAAMLGVIMLVAIVVVHWSGGLFAHNGGFEYPLALLGMSLALFALGGGALSVDGLIASNKTEGINSPQTTEPGQAWGASSS